MLGERSLGRVRRVEPGAVGLHFGGAGLGGRGPRAFRSEMPLRNVRHIPTALLLAVVVAVALAVGGRGVLLVRVVAGDVVRPGVPHRLQELPESLVGRRSEPIGVRRFQRTRHEAELPWLGSCAEHGGEQRADREPKLVRVIFPFLEPVRTDPRGSEFRRQHAPEVDGAELVAFPGGLHDLRDVPHVQPVGEFGHEGQDGRHVGGNEPEQRAHNRLGRRLHVGQAGGARRDLLQDVGSLDSRFLLIGLADRRDLLAGIPFEGVLGLDDAHVQQIQETHFFLLYSRNGESYLK